MKNDKAILKVGAALLLLVMMLSITPKSFLHEVLADHKDAPSCNDSRLDGPCIHKQGYSCQQSDVVVPTAYVVTEAQVVIAHPHFGNDKNSFYTSSPTKNIVRLSKERAPPALV